MAVCRVDFVGLCRTQIAFMYSMHILLENMKPGHWTILSLFIFVQLIAACSSGTDDNANTSNANIPAVNSTPDPSFEGIKDSAEELGTLVNLPVEPEEVVWKEFQNGSGRKILAVMSFTPSNTKRMIELVRRHGEGVSVNVIAEKWFPAELTTQSEINYDHGIKAISFPATEFYSGSYNSGNIANVEETDFFVLELTVK